jgi:hypothetical protein
MTAAIALRCDPIAESMAEIFDRPAPDVIGELLIEYVERRKQISQVAAIFGGDLKRAVPYFAAARADDSYTRYASDFAERLFADEAGAIKVLDAEMWERALETTDVLSCMPQKRRNEWHEQIRGRKVPEFTAANVDNTLKQQLADRYRYFAERVDGVFQALSPDHRTNLASGFGGKLIIAHVHSGCYTEPSRIGYLSDLRAVVAKFMGRDEPKYYAANSHVVKVCLQHRGKWVQLDGGALAVRMYKCGTMHIRLHDNMVWRLNAVLESLHPRAIPEDRRTRPKTKRPKTYTMIGRPLPFAVLNVLAIADLQKDGGEWALSFSSHDRDENKLVRDEAASAVASIGGTRRVHDRESYWFDTFYFDYSPRDVIDEIIASGCIPDQRAHQFYPTPVELAERVVKLAEIRDEVGELILEPSAGQGGLAKFLPPHRTTCVEISALHCEILRARRYEVVQADFLAWTTKQRFARVVMNPPFSDGRWLAHLQHAAELLRDDGRLVAILPASARGKDVLPGWSLTWSEPIGNAFAGTSISVVILTAERS